MDSLLLSAPSVSARLAARRAETRKWARIAYQLDRELGPVTFQPVEMLAGESVAEWRARNLAAMEAAR